MLNNIASILGVGGGVATDYESIATVTVGSAVSSITFSSIPSTYTHLQIRALNLTTTAGSSSLTQFNSDTTSSNYRNHYMAGTGSSAIAGSNAGMYAPNFQGGSSSPGVAIIDILDYANTNKYKVVRCLDGYDANGSGYIGLTSSLWLNTAAITSIKFNTTNFLTNTSFALYGIK